MSTATLEKPKLTQLLEFSSSAGGALTVDRAAGVIKNVKILGLHSANGRDYLPEAVKSAIGLYEGAKVNVDHPAKGQTAPRGYGERLGALSGVHYVEGDGLRGDLKYNPKHALAEQLAWDAENSPANVGLSHNVLGRTNQRNGKTVVEAITRVVSVDLVADPATNRGLFESTETEPLIEGFEMKDLTLDTLRAGRPDLVKAISEATIQEQTQGDAAKTAAAELKSLKEQLDTLKAKEAMTVKRAAVEKAIAEAKLPKELVSEVFTEQLLSADEAGMKKLIEDRQTIAKGYKPSGKPISSDAALSEGVSAGEIDTKKVASRLRG